MKPSFDSAGVVRTEADHHTKRGAFKSVSFGAKVAVWAGVLALLWIFDA